MFQRSEAMTRWFAQYDRDHVDPRNRRAHAVCIPLIVLTAIGFLQQIPGHQVLLGVPLGWAELVLALVLAFYAQHDLKLALLAALAASVLDVAARAIPLWAHLALAVPAWILQLGGHAWWEHNRPSFATNLIQTLVGPLYFLAELGRKA